MNSLRKKLIFDPLNFLLVTPTIRVWDFYDVDSKDMPVIARRNRERKATIR